MLDDATLIVFFLCVFAVIVYFVPSITRSPSILAKLHQNKKLQLGLTVAIFAFAFFLRLFALAAVPPGLNQDEATIGYDAWTIANYGMDRNQSVLPPYPVGMGVGNGTFYAYFAAPFIRLFGLNLFTYRLPNALLACFSCYCFFCISKRARGVNFAILSLAIYAVTPVLVTNARFAVDYTTQISLITIAIYLFIETVERKRSWLFAVTGALLAWFTGSYGSMIIIIPLFLVFSSLYAIITKSMGRKHFFILCIAYAIFSIPLICVLLVNFFNVPPFKLFGIFSIDQFSTNYADGKFHKLDGSFIKEVFGSIKKLFDLTIKQKDVAPIDAYIPQYGLTHYFTIPLILLGIILSFKNFRKIKEYKPETIICISWLSSTIFALLTNTTIQRLLTLFPIYVYFIALAIRFIYHRVHIIMPVLIIIFAIHTTTFTHYYFKEYKQDMGNFFFYSLGDAIQFATAQTDNEICVTRTNSNVPEYIVLFYSKVPPQTFSSTVKYHDPNVPFRHIQSVSRFTFGIPPEKNPDTVYIIANSEIDQFDRSLFYIKQFQNYSVAYPR